jgi:hypothetical protein
VAARRRTRLMLGAPVGSQACQGGCLSLSASFSSLCALLPQLRSKTNCHRPVPSSGASKPLSRVSCLTSSHSFTADTLPFQLPVLYRLYITRACNNPIQNPWTTRLTAPSLQLADPFSFASSTRPSSPQVNYFVPLPNARFLLQIPGWGCNVHNGPLKSKDQGK